MPGWRRTTRRVCRLWWARTSSWQRGAAFLQTQAADCLQPDLINRGGITAAGAASRTLLRSTVSLSPVTMSAITCSTYAQQFSAAIFNCPLMEAPGTLLTRPRRGGREAGHRRRTMKVASRPGLGLQLDFDYLKANRAEGEPWWD